MKDVEIFKSKTEDFIYIRPVSEKSKSFFQRRFAESFTYPGCYPFNPAMVSPERLLITMEEMGFTAKVV